MPNRTNKLSRYTSKFIPTSIRDIFKQSNLIGLRHTMSCVIYIIQTAQSSSESEWVVPCQLMVIDLIGQLNGDVIDLSVKP